MTDFVESKEFELRVSVLRIDRYEELRNAAKNCLALLYDNENDPAARFIVSGEGNSGNFEVSAIWNPNKPYACAPRFSSNRVKQVVLRFITKGVIT